MGRVLWGREDAFRLNEIIPPLSTGDMSGSSASSRGFLHGTRGFEVLHR